MRTVACNSCAGAIQKKERKIVKNMQENDIKV